MAGASSLLKSAANTKKKIQQQEDAFVAYDWQNSAQTYEDFQAYSSFLNERQSNTDDPSQKLSYSKTITSARRSYVSNELQRQQMSIMEGRSTTQDKMGAVYSLYAQAIDNGDNNLAQNLASQYDSLSVKLQNEAEAAQRAAGALAMNGVKTLDQLVKRVTKGVDGLELPDGSFIKPLGLLNSELTSGKSLDNFFQQAHDTIQALQQIVADAYAGAQSQEAVDAIESKYGDIITGDKKFDVGGQQLTPQDVELAFRSGLARNPTYSPQEVRNESTGSLEYKLVKNKVDNFIWVRNDDGTYQAVQERAKVINPYQNLDAKITNEGYFLGASGKAGVSNIGDGQQVKTASAASIGERLQQQGVTASQNSDGTLDLVLPSGEQVKGAIQPDGSIRYFGQPGDFSGGNAGMYEINIFNGQTREVAPDESSIFGQTSQFGGQISKASDAGTRIIQSLAGITKTSEQLFSPLDRITNPGVNDFTGTGTPSITPNLQGGTSGVLQGAAGVRAKLQADEQAKIQAEQRSQQMLQPAQAFNLNQTPVQQFAANGQPVRQLNVAAPTPTPRLSVAAPAPAPRVVVGPAPNSGTISGVSVAPAQPRIVVR